MNIEIFRRQFTPSNFAFYMDTLINLPPYHGFEDNMISIHDPNDDSDAPELFQIEKWKNGNYVYTHLERDTYHVLTKIVINPYIFKLNLPYNYNIEIRYGPTLIDPTLSYDYTFQGPILLTP